MSPTSYLTAPPRVKCEGIIAVVRRFVKHLIEKQKARTMAYRLNAGFTIVIIVQRVALTGTLSICPERSRVVALSRLSVAMSRTEVL